jgi:hypothetical protein
MALRIMAAAGFTLRESKGLPDDETLHTTSTLFADFVATLEESGLIQFAALSATIGRYPSGTLI